MSSQPSPTKTKALALLDAAVQAALEAGAASIDDDRVVRWVGFGVGFDAGGSPAVLRRELLCRPGLGQRCRDACGEIDGLAALRRREAALTAELDAITIGLAARGQASSATSLRIEGLLGDASFRVPWSVESERERRVQ